MYNKQVIDGEVDVKKLAYEEIMWTSQEKFSAKSWSKLHIKGNVLLRTKYPVPLSSLGTLSLFFYCTVRITSFLYVPNFR